MKSFRTEVMQLISMVYLYWLIYSVLPLNKIPISSSLTNEEGNLSAKLKIYQLEALSNSMVSRNKELCYGFRLPVSLVVSWPEGNAVDNNEQRTAGQIIGKCTSGYITNPSLFHTGHLFLQFT